MNAKLFNIYDITLNEVEAGQYQLTDSLSLSKSDLWQYLSKEFALPLAYFELLADNITLDGLTFYKDASPQKIELTLGCDDIMMSIFNFSSIQLTLNTENNILQL